MMPEASLSPTTLYRVLSLCACTRLAPRGWPPRAHSAQAMVEARGCGCPEGAPPPEASLGCGAGGVTGSRLRYVWASVML